MGSARPAAPSLRRGLLGWSLDRLARRLVDDHPVAGHAAPGDDLVGEVGREHPVAVVVLGGHQGDQVDDVLGVELRGRSGHLARHVAAAPDLGVADPDHLAGHRPLDVAAALGGEVDHDGAGLHLLDHLAGDQHRSLAPRHGGGRDQRVGGGDERREQLALPCRAVLGHLAGVAAGALEGVEVEVDGLGPHRPDLLGGGRAHVVGPDDGAEPLGGRDGLQPRDAGAENDHLGGLDGAGRGHVEREEAAQHPGGDDRAAVAGDERLRAERVHRLCARDARDQLDGVGGDARVAELHDRGLLGGGRQERDRGRAAGQPADGAGVERLDRDDESASARASGSRVAPDRGVLLVGDQGVQPGPRLDRDVVPETGELADQLGHHRHARLALTGLLGHCDLHPAEPRTYPPPLPPISSFPRRGVSPGAGSRCSVTFRIVRGRFPVRSSRTTPRARIPPPVGGGVGHADPRRGTTPPG